MLVGGGSVSRESMCLSFQGMCLRPPSVSVRKRVLERKMLLFTFFFFGPDPEARMDGECEAIGSTCQLHVSSGDKQGCSLRFR